MAKMHYHESPLIPVILYFFIGKIVDKISQKLSWFFSLFSVSRIMCMDFE